MNTFSKIFFGIFILSLPSLLNSCAINPVTGKHELMLVSESQEIEIGKEAEPSLQWEFGGYYSDSYLQSYLESIVRELWQSSERPYLPFKFHIQNTSIPNAFALPGNVAITRGLLSEMENEAQFVAVMGHEVGHVMAKHTAQKLSRLTLQQLGLTIGAVALEGREGGDVLLTLGAVGSSLLLLSYDRQQEIQADRLGVKYMAKLGYEPTEAISAHKVLERSVNDYMERLKKKRTEDNFITRILSTHPRTEIRISEIQSMIAELPPYTLREDGRFSKRFQDAIKNIQEVNKVYFIYDEAENLYQKESFDAAEERLNKAISLNDKQAPFYNLMGFIKLRQKNNTEAEKAFQKAISIDNLYQPSYYGLGLTYYYKKNYGQAVVEFKKSLNLFPNHVQTHFGLGKSYFQLQQYKEAIPFLENFARVTPKHPEVHGLLGVSYDSIGDVKSAVREYNYQLQVAPDTELGRYAKKRLAMLKFLLK